jgi:hypothetical protein
MSDSICVRMLGGAVSAALSILAASAALAQTPVSAGFEWSNLYTAWGHVTALETGWHDDTMSITLDPSVPFVNSGHRSPVVNQPFVSCKITTAGYALDPKDPGVKAHEAVLLAAFIAGKKVRLLINACAYDKPRVIAVGITD